MDYIIFTGTVRRRDLCKFNRGLLANITGRGSGQVRTKADEGEGQRAGLGISPAGVETDWIQRQGGRALIPCVGSSQGDGVGDGGRDRQRLE